MWINLKLLLYSVFPAHPAAWPQNVITCSSMPQYRITWRQERRPGEENQVISYHTKRQDLKPLEDVSLRLERHWPSSRGLQNLREQASKKPAPDLVYKNIEQVLPPVVNSGTPWLECLGPAESSSGLYCAVPRFFPKCSGPHTYMWGLSSWWLVLRGQSWR